MAQNIGNVIVLTRGFKGLIDYVEIIFVAFTQKAYCYIGLLRGMLRKIRNESDYVSNCRAQQHYSITAQYGTVLRSVNATLVTLFFSLMPISHRRHSKTKLS